MRILDKIIIFILIISLVSGCAEKKKKTKIRTTVKKTSTEKAGNLYNNIDKNSSKESLKGIIKYFSKELEKNPDNAYAMFNIGRAYRYLNETGLAIDFLNKAIKARPAWADPYLELAQIYKDKSRNDEVIILYEKIKKIEPEKLDIRYELARFYEEKNKKGQAINDYEFIYAKNPDYSDIKERLMDLYLSLSKEKIKDKDNTVALIYLDKILEINPASSEARYEKAKILFKQKDFPASAKEFVLSKKYGGPDDSVKYLALCYYETGDTTNALNEFEQAYAIYPNDLIILDKLAQIYYYKKDYAKSLEYFSKASKISKDKSDKYRYSLWIGKDYFELKDYNKAIENFQTALKLSKKDDTIFSYLADSYFFSGQYKTAIKYYLKFLENNQDKAALNNLAKCYYEIEAYNEQLNILMKLKSIDPSVQNLNKEIARGYYSIAKNYIDKGKKSKSIANLENAIKYFPTNPEYRYDMAMIYKEAGKLVDMASQLQAILTFDKTYSKAYYELAKYYFINNKVEEGMDNFRNAIKYSPEKINYLKEFADFLSENKRYEEAIPYYEQFISRTKNDILKTIALTKLGEIFYNINQKSRALTLFEKSLKINSKQLDAVLFLSDIYAEKQEIKKAISVLETFLSYGIGKEKIYLRLYNLYLKINNTKFALKYLNNAIKEAPDSFDNRYLLANLYYNEKQPKNVIKILKDSLKLKLTDEEKNLCYKMLSKVYFELNDKDNALSYLKKVVGIAPEHKDFYYIAKIYESKKLYNAAISQMIRALELDKSNKEYNYYLGNLYLLNKQNSEAIKYLKRAVSLGIKKDAYKSLSDIYLNIGKKEYSDNNLETALKNFKTALNYDKENYDAYYLIAKIYKDLKEYDNSLATFNKYLKIKKDDVNVLKEIGDIYAQTDNRIKAIKFYLEAADKGLLDKDVFLYLGRYFLNKNDYVNARRYLDKIEKIAPVTDAQVLMLLGNLYTKVEDYKLASKYYEKLLNLTPRDYNIAVKLGEISLLMNDFSKARDYFNYVLNIDEKNINALLYLADLETKNKNYPAAENFLTRALEIKPDYNLIREKLGKVYLYQNKLELAAKEFSKSIEDSIDKEKALMRISDIYIKIADEKLNKKEFSKSFYFLDKAKKINPKNYKIYNLYGLIHLEKNELLDAANNFLMAMNLKPDAYDPGLNYAVVLIKQAQYKDAIKILDRLGEHNVSVLINKAVCMMNLGDLPTAAKFIKKAISMQPDNITAHLNRGIILIKKKLYKNALDDFLYVLEKKKDPDAFYYSGICYEKLDIKDMAIKHYEKAIELTPENIVYYFNYADILASTGKYDEAIRSYFRILEKNPFMYEIRFNLGEIYKEKKEYQKAIEQFKIIEKAGKFDKKDKLFNSMGAVYFFMKDDAQAENYYLKAIKENKKNYKAYYNMAILKFNSNNFNEAVNYSKKVISINDKYALAYQLMGFIYYKADYFTEAAVLFDKALELNPYLEKSQYLKKEIEARAELLHR